MDIHPTVWSSLGHYVYAYVDPRNEAIRYIGKGTGARAVAHLEDRNRSPKTEWIQELREMNIQPRIDILARNLSERQALRLERTLIDAIGIGEHRLTNKVRGHGVKTGREPIEEIAVKMNPEPLIGHHRLLVVKLNKHFRPGLDPMQLYDLARGVWTLGSARNDVEYVLALAHGLVRGVYCVEKWHPAGTTPYLHLPRDDVDDEEFAHRWEFVGAPAPPEVAELYLHKDASRWFKRGNANPIGYVFPE